MEENRLKELGNRKQVFRPEREELTRDWRKLPNGEFRVFCCSSNGIKLIKLRKMRFLGYMARIGERLLWGFGGDT